MWHRNFIFIKMEELLSKSSYILHKIHSHSHLILDPESVFYDHFRCGEAPLYNYVAKYKVLLVVDVVKLTVSLTGLIIMLTTPWHLHPRTLLKKRVNPFGLSHVS